MLLVALVGGGHQEEKKAGTSYDASPHGFRAAYLLLDELGYPVARSRRPTGEAVRWVLFPVSTKEAGALGEWVRQGGVLVLGVENGDFLQAMGLQLTVGKPAEAGEEPAGSVEGVTRLAGGPVRVKLAGSPGRVWAEAGGQPMVTIHERGRGWLWLLNRPQFLTNELIGQADNAILLCRLAEATLQDRPGKLAFDEFFHGMRERAGVAELLLQPPTLWVTLQSLLLLGLVLWHYTPRFGPLYPPVPLRRRSKEEFLEAMASLLARKGDTADALRTIRDGLVRELEQEMGLPPGTPVERTIDEAIRRRSLRPEPLRALLRADRRIGFLKALNDLETARNEFFHGRPQR
jgi:hypothetical protein